MGKLMNLNFEMLKERILDTNKFSDLKKINSQLGEMKHSVICVGTGGSNVVSEYASKIFNT
jgi:fructoselysine-6-P-deglycase FrlB-like protein